MAEPLHNVMNGVQNVDSFEVTEDCWAFNGSVVQSKSVGDRSLGSGIFETEYGNLTNTSHHPLFLQMNHMRTNQESKTR